LAAQGARFTVQGSRERDREENEIGNGFIGFTGFIGFIGLEIGARCMVRERNADASPFAMDHVPYPVSLIISPVNPVRKFYYSRAPCALHRAPSYLILHYLRVTPSGEITKSSANRIPEKRFSTISTESSMNSI
jgi:hypothetical protein